MTRLLNILLPLLLGIAVIACWEWIVRARAIPPYILPAPSAIARALAQNFGSLMLSVGLGLAMAAGHIFIVAFVVILTYGISNGLKAVQRATLPLALFGRAQFGAYMGRLALPQGVVAAVAPPIMASVLNRFGTPGALWLCFGFAMISLATMILLAQRSRAVR